MCVIQPMQYPNGVTKGAKTVLEERGLIKKNTGRALLMRCGVCKYVGGLYMDDKERTSCCAVRMLSLQLDFEEQRGLVEEVILARGHRCVFLPAFHPEINPIERYWAFCKNITNDPQRVDSNAELLSVLEDTLINVPLVTIRRYARASNRLCVLYSQGVDGLRIVEEYKKIYKSHRRRVAGPSLDSHSVGEGLGDLEDNP